MKYILTVVVGFIIGCISTYFYIGHNYVVQHPEDVEVVSYANLTEFDLKDIGERHALITLWYMEQDDISSMLSHHTGRKFKPVAKLYTGPVEILEEQLDFMRDFMAESDRIEKEERAQYEKNNTEQSR